MLRLPESDGPRDSGYRLRRIGTRHEPTPRKMRHVRGALDEDRRLTQHSTFIAPQAERIFADKRAVKQMLVNLLSNGVKFTPRGGEVRVTATIDAKGLEIAVRDTGTGISRADLEKLGRPFEQVEGPQTRSKEGTGLGLALVKSLASMHGGEAILESALGEGTIVRLRLPHAAVSADGARLNPAQMAPGAKVLPFRAAS